MRILVRATNWLGDAVMCLPALQALRAAHPAAHIAILARPWVADLYGQEPFCDELIPYEAERGWRDWGTKWAIARGLRERQFDCAVLLPNAFEAAAVAWLAGIPRRVGNRRDGRSVLLTDAVTVPEKGETPAHQRFYYLELLRRAGLIATRGESSVIRLASAGIRAQAGRARFGDGGPVIGVSPGAAYGGAKRWLPERFAEAAVTVASEMGGRVAVFGSAGEAGLCAEVAAMVGAAGVAVEDFAGRTGLAEFLDRAAACQVFFTNDSGAMHVASALGVPTVAVFGATDAEATGPTGSLARVVQHFAECSPCLLRECPIDHRCMRNVGSVEVAAAARELIVLAAGGN